MKIFAKIRFYWGAAVISLVVALIMIPLIHLFPRHKGTIMHTLNRAILFLLGATIQTVGMRDPASQLFVFNHQGIIDIITMEAVANTHMAWIAKKELFDTPIYGHLLKGGGMISVDRQNKAGLIRLLHDAEARIAEGGRALAIFPEGTRARGQKLLPFKAGAKLLANRLRLRVQPVVITGSKWLLNEHNRTAHNATVKVMYLTAFNVSEMPQTWYEDLRETMQHVIDEEQSVHGRER